MTISELIKELTKKDLKPDDQIRFYYLKNNELIGCSFESVAFRDQIEFTLQDESEVNNND